jgi:hypothetical protein
LKPPEIEAPDGPGRNHGSTWWDLFLPPAIALSVGAAAIHFAVAPEHFSEYWLFGLFFAGIAWFQSLWPLALVRFRNGLTPAIGIVVNMATAAVWAWTRVVAVPVGPTAGERETTGLADIAATGFEVLLTCVLVGRLVPGLRSALDQRAARTAWTGSIAWVVLIVSITTLILAIHGNEIMVMTH